GSDVARARQLSREAPRPRLRDRGAEVLDRAEPGQHAPAAGAARRLPGKAEKAAESDEKGQKMTRSVGPLRAAVAAVLLLALAAPASAREESRESGGNFDRDFSKTLPVKAGQKLEIEHSQGSLRIGTHALNEVRVKAKITVSSSDGEWAQKFGEGIAITVEDVGSTIAIRTKYPDQGIHFSGRGHVSFAVDMEVTMPETMPLSARCKFGDVSVAGLKAAGTVVNANGQLAFSEGRGRQRL